MPLTLFSIYDGKSPVRRAQFSVSLDAKDFDSITGGKTTLELYVSVDYRGEQTRRFKYYYHSSYNHLSGQFDIIDEK